jgi:hypothetical protein
MIAPRLVHLIETHSDGLVRGLMEKLDRCPRLTEYNKVPDDEIKHRVHEIYRHLGEWLLQKPESDVEKWYTAIGARRAAQGVPLSQLVCAIMLSKEHLWDFLKQEAVDDRHIELFQELELFRMVDQFFDRAVYHAAVGYERARAARAA